jgi:hypothetical protein
MNIGTALQPSKLQQRRGAAGFVERLGVSLGAGERTMP